MSFVKNENEKQKVKNYRLHPALALAAVMGLTISVSGTIPSAAAVTEVILDPSFGCLQDDWGIKDHTNDETGLWEFGGVHNCIGPPWPIYYGVGNHVKVHSAITTTRVQWDTAWEAAIEGTDPWGTHGNTSPFPQSSTNNYSLHAKWVWTNDAKPTNADVRAFYLTDLWLKNPSNNKRMVIDFMWDRLASSGGNWVQQSTGSSQYFTPYCDSEGGIDTYHYNVVMDDTTTTAGTWNDKSANINTNLNNAFSYTYGTGGNGIACSNSSPGTRSSYNIVDVESGIEVQATAGGGKGKAEGGYSMTSLSY